MTLDQLNLKNQFRANCAKRTTTLPPNTAIQLGNNALPLPGRVILGIQKSPKKADVTDLNPENQL